MTNISRRFLYTGTFAGDWFPGPMGNGDAAVGMEGGDAKRLATLLEYHLGIPSQKQVHFLERAADSIVSIREYCKTQPTAYFATSFNIDEYGVACYLLSLRDELLMSGWNGDPSLLPKRLAEAMAALTHDGSPFDDSGLPFRLNAIIAMLQKRPRRIFDTIYYVRDIAGEPLLVQKLFNALASTGTAMCAWPDEHASQEDKDTDLRRAQSKVTRGTQFCPAGDGTLILLKGDNRYDAAEAVASWIVCNTPPGLLIIADHDSRFELNEALMRYHLPALGGTFTSPNRSAVQALRLSFAVRWKPFNPHLLLELLQLPLSPIPRGAGRRLAKALAETPGLDNHVWHEAVRICLEADDGNDSEDRPLKECFDAWLPSGSTLLDDGAEMSVAQIGAICDAFSDWAVRRSFAFKHTKSDVMSSDFGEGERASHVLEAAALVAERLKRIVERSGRRGLRLTQLDFLLDRLIGGVEMSYAPEQEGSINSVAAPSAVLGQSDTVIWWNFTRSSAERIPAMLITERERMELAQQGIILPAVSAQAPAIAGEWRRPILAATKRLILVMCDTHLGETQRPHPVWDEVAAGWSTSEKGKVTIHVRDILKGNQSHFAVKREQVRSLEEPKPYFQLTISKLIPRLRGVESATSLETLLTCPLRYFLKYQAGLRGAEAIVLADDNRVRGNIGHRVIHEVFGSGAFPSTRDDAMNHAETVFENLLSSEGATLLLPGKEVGREAFRRAVRIAAGVFYDFVGKNNLSIVGFEKECSGETEIGTIKGYVDLLLEDTNRRPLVIDMKYSEKGERYYADRLKNEQAVQLAVYARMAGNGAHAMYLSLKDASFITTGRNEFAEVRSLNDISFDETWRRLVATVRYILENEFSNSLVYATGVMKKMNVVPRGTIPNDFLELEPLCDYCEYRPLCGVVWLVNGGTQ